MGTKGIKSKKMFPSGPFIIVVADGYLIAGAMMSRLLFLS